MGRISRIAVRQVRKAAILGQKEGNTGLRDPHSEMLPGSPMIEEHFVRLNAESLPRNVLQGDIF